MDAKHVNNSVTITYGKIVSSAYTGYFRMTLRQSTFLEMLLSQSPIGLKYP